MEIDISKINKTKGYFEGRLDAVDSATALIAASYKKNVCRNFSAINPSQIDDRVGGEEFYVTRKYDGEMNVLFYNEKETFIINTGGKVRTGLSCTEEAGRALKRAGISKAVIPSELYVCESDGRKRVFDVLSALADEKEAAKLCLAPFDIIEIDGAPPRYKNYEELYKKLDEVFGGFEAVKQVRFSKASTKAELKDIYRRWVEEEGSEGLVVRSELPVVYKIKPKHNLDAVVIGYTEGMGEYSGQVRTLLLALMADDNTFQVIGRTGNGFSSEQKKELLEKLSKTVIDSDFIETDSNHVGFRMVEPSIVIELSFNDIIFETSTSPVLNPVLTIKDGSYRFITSCNGISLIFPVFERVREDKRAVCHDVRLSQITEDFYLPDFGKCLSTAALPESEVLQREVYKKEAKDKLMVQKFIVIKTNKEDKDERYPAYVLHYTNFSSDRKEPLQRDIRISNSREQILELLEEFKNENIKKGWIKV
ncbi:MAG TPA: hypothetical protein VF941_04555 [Clostridia bacterium]